MVSIGAKMLILVLIGYAQLPKFNAHADIPIKARSLKCCLTLHLLSLFIYASSKGYGESAHMRRIAITLVAR